MGEISSVWWFELPVLTKQARGGGACEDDADTSVKDEQSSDVKLEARGDAKGPDVPEGCRLWEWLQRRRWVPAGSQLYLQQLTQVQQKTSAIYRAMRNVRRGRTDRR